MSQHPQQPTVTESSHNPHGFPDSPSSDNGTRFTVDLTMFDLVAAIIKRWKMIIGVPLLAAIVAAVITLFLPKIYTAKTMIIPGEDEGGGMLTAMLVQMGGMGGLANGLVGGTTKADLYVTILKSEPVKDGIIDRFKLMDVYGAEFRASAYRTLDKRVFIASGKKDGVISIAVDDKDPKRAADMANAYVDELGSLVAGLNMTGAEKNNVFLEKRLAETRADLARAEEALKKFQQSNKAVSVADQAKASIEGVAALRAQLATQEVQLATLRRQFTDSSQEVKTAEAAVANLHNQIAKLEGSGRSSSIPSIGSVPQLGQEHLRLMREYKIHEAVLEMLTKQLEVSKVTATRDVSAFKVLQPAKVPELKSKPQRAKICLTVTFVATVLMLVVAGLLEVSSKMPTVPDESDAPLQKLLSALRKHRKSVPKI